MFSPGFVSSRKTLSQLVVKHRKITCYDDGETGFAEDMCSSGEDYKYEMLPDRTMPNGVVVQEMYCKFKENG